MNKISIAEDFTIYPGGRVPEDGPFSGKEFMEKFLIPALDSGIKTEINFDGTRGYGSSFLEEAFGGLIRLKYSKEKILNTFTFVSKRQGVLDSIYEYINAAADRK